MWNKDGISKVVPNAEYQSHLKDGWTDRKPVSLKLKKKEEVQEEPAESTLLEMEATVDVIKKKKEK